MNSSNLLSLISINATWYHTRTSDFLRVDFHRTNYGVHEPLNGAVRSFNEFPGLFDLHLHRNQFFNRLRSVLKYLLILHSLLDKTVHVSLLFFGSHGSQVCRFIDLSSSRVLILVLIRFFFIFYCFYFCFLNVFILILSWNLWKLSVKLKSVGK
jgi:hypothetical protein